MTVLGAVYVLRRGSEDFDTMIVKLESEVVGYLPAGRDDDALRLFEVGDIKDALQRELFEIEPV